jgi:hypothetical protein
MADAPNPITSPPSVPPAPYDAASDAADGPWVKISENLAGGSNDLWNADFPDSAPWRQT